VAGNPRDEQKKRRIQRVAQQVSYQQENETARRARGRHERSCNPRGGQDNEKQKKQKQSSKRRYGQVIDKWKKGAMQ
jgi:hypothetical protein